MRKNKDSQKFEKNVEEHFKELEEKDTVRNTELDTPPPADLDISSTSENSDTIAEEV
jgi:hypothetical protein